MYLNKKQSDTCTDTSIGKNQAGSACNNYIFTNILQCIKMLQCLDKN